MDDINILMNEILDSVPLAEAALARREQESQIYGSAEWLLAHYPNMTLEDYFSMKTSGTYDDFIAGTYFNTRGRKKILYELYNSNNTLLVSGEVHDIAKYFNVTDRAIYMRDHNGWFSYHGYKLVKL